MPPVQPMSTADKVWWNVGRLWLTASLVVSVYVSVVLMPAFVSDALNVPSNGGAAKILQLVLPVTGLIFVFPLVWQA